MKAIAIENPGPHYRLVLRESETPRPGPGQILLKVAGAGINRADLLQAEGRYPPPPGAPETPGLEISGEVVEVGQGVARNIGDKLCALLPGGGYADYALASDLCVLPVPPRIALADAAALPEAHFTAWTNLIDTARLQPGESVLVHGGAGGIGTAAIQMLAARGHPVFATASSREKCTLCEKLGARRAIDYAQEDFVAVIATETGGRGVDVILDMVGGDYIGRNMAAAAARGRIVNIAYQKGARATVDFAPMLRKGLSLHATTLRGRPNAEKGAIRDALARAVWPLVAEGRIVPPVDSHFPLAEAQKAHERMRNGAHSGKILLIP